MPKDTLRVEWMRQERNKGDGRKNIVTIVLGLFLQNFAMRAILGRQRVYRPTKVDLFGGVFLVI